MVNCQVQIEGVVCGNPDARMFLPGMCCSLHTPAAMAGRADHVPDPEFTLDAIRARKGLTYSYRVTDSTLNDQRAIASGKRRSTGTQYKTARAAEEQRKANK